MAFKTDIEIAREAKKKNIMEIGAKLGIPSESLLPYGHDKAKVSQEFIKSLAGKKRRQADPRDRDQPDPGWRRQDHHDRGSGRWPEPHRQESRDLHP